MPGSEPVVVRSTTRAASSASATTIVSWTPGEITMAGRNTRSHQATGSNQGSRNGNASGGPFNADVQAGPSNQLVPPVTHADVSGAQEETQDPLDLNSYSILSYVGS